MPFSKDDFTDSIRHKHEQYYLYNEFFRPVELTFFGAFFSVYLAFIFNDLLKIIEPAKYHGWPNFEVQKYGVTIGFGFLIVVELWIITLAFDYTLRPAPRVVIYSVVLIILHSVFSGSLMLTGMFQSQAIGWDLWLRIAIVLPVLFIFWIIFREGMRFYSRITYKIRGKDYLGKREVTPCDCPCPARSRQAQKAASCPKIKG